jgi:hypothetical protein
MAAQSLVTSLNLIARVSRNCYEKALIKRTVMVSGVYSHTQHLIHPIDGNEMISKNNTDGVESWPTQYVFHFIVRSADEVNDLAEKAAAEKARQLRREEYERILAIEREQKVYIPVSNYILDLLEEYDEDINSGYLYKSMADHPSC